MMNGCQVFGASQVGRRKNNETLLQNIVREVKEETNLDISPQKIKFLPEISKKLNHIFFATTDFSGEMALDQENDDFRWVKINEIDENSSIPHLKDEVLAGYAAFFPFLRLKIGKN